MATADLVVSMGGYNTLSEVLSQQKLSLIIPRQHPRKEQLIRARVFHAKGLSEYISLPEFSEALLNDKIQRLLEKPAPYQEALDRFQFTGIDTMRRRIDNIRSYRNVAAC